MKNGFVMHSISTVWIMIAVYTNLQLILFWVMMKLAQIQAKVSCISPFLCLEDYDEDDLNEAATYLYGMIHARYIITLDGLEQMVLLLHFVKILGV